MFRITGLIDNKEHSLFFKNGKLTGSSIAVGSARAENEKDHGLVGMWSYSEQKGNYLVSEIPAYALCYEYVFDSIISVKTDFEKIPEGAID